MKHLKWQSNLSLGDGYYWSKIIEAKEMTHQKFLITFELGTKQVIKQTFNVSNQPASIYGKLLQSTVGSTEKIAINELIHKQSVLQLESNGPDILITDIRTVEEFQ